MRRRFKFAVAVSVCLAGQAVAENATLDPLFEALREAEGPAAEQIEGKIWQEWSNSGSPSMDLLLQRGREAIDAGEIERAIEHLTALVNHAPDFAEAYNARATAYFQAGLYGPSIEDIRQTLRLNPRHFGAIFGLALILEETGDAKGALEAYREVEKLHPNRQGLRPTINRLSREVEGDAI